MRIGLHLDGVPFGGLGPLVEVERAIGRVEIVHWFQAWGGGHHGFEPSWLDEVSAADRTGLITWEPWALDGSVDQPDFAPAAIAAGNHDHYIVQWAEGFAARTDGPWYLRPMHEMNGDWYPWGGGRPAVSASTFRQAWSRMHRLFAEAGAHDVRWVWCPLADDVAGPFEDYYPGRQEVDVLALDGYNWGASRPDHGGWRSPSDLFDQAYRRLAALGQQPVWLAEVGSAPDGGSKAAWVDEVVRSPGRPRVEAVVFFGLDKERDWRVHDDPEVAAAIRAHTSR